MRKLFLPVLLIAISFSFTTDDWKKINLDDKASIEFPTDPVENENGNVHIWNTDNQNLYRCMALVLNYTSYGLDSAKLAEELAGEQFYEDFSSSMLAQIDGAEMQKDEKTKYQGYLSYNMTVNLTKGGGGFTKMYCHNIFVGTKMYSISFFERGDKPQAELKKRYFESLKIK